MWWNDIKEIKEWMGNVSDRLSVIDQYLRNTLEDEKDAIDRLHDKIDVLVNDEKRIAQVALAEKILDKFEDYMKNVDKLNGMINELKGCASMCRGAAIERKEADAQVGRDIITNLVPRMDYMHKSIIDYMHQNAQKLAKFMKKYEKDSPKKEKVVKKKKEVPASLSQ